MEVNSHTLPNSFIEALNNNAFYREIGSWPLKNENDSFGNYLETELGQVFTTQKEIIKETKKLSTNFEPDEAYGKDSEWKEEPGFIKDITGFTNIVAFAAAGDGSPFCFDFRESESIPEIVVIPDLDVPGIRAMVCPSPITKDCRAVTSSSRLLEPLSCFSTIINTIPQKIKLVATTVEV